MSCRAAPAHSPGLTSGAPTAISRRARDDPVLFARRFDIDRVNNILEELKRVYSSGTELEIAIGIVEIAHFYFATKDESFISKNAGKTACGIVFQRFGFNILLWGNYIYSTLTECRKGLHEHGGGGTCRVESLLDSIEVNQGLWLQNTFLTDFNVAPAVSICPVGEWCTRLS